MAIINAKIVINFSSVFIFLFYCSLGDRSRDVPTLVTEKRFGTSVPTSLIDKNLRHSAEGCCQIHQQRGEGIKMNFVLRASRRNIFKIPEL